MNNDTATNEAAPRATLERDRQIVEAFPDAVYTCDADGRVTFYNSAAVVLWGREPELGRDLWCGSWKIYRLDGTLLPLDECPMAVTIRERRAVDGVEIIIERPDGVRRHVVPYPRPIFDAAGELAGAVNTLVDVTDRRKAEEAATRLAAIITSSDDAIIGKTLNGVITSWNESAERIFGYTPAEAIGRHISFIIPPERQSEEDEVLARLRLGERVDHFETDRRAKNGRTVNVSLTVSPIRDGKGRIIGASTVARDITDRKSAEEALREADRRKDEFLATLSHELRNPLNAMLGWVRMLRSGTLEPETAQRAIAVIERNIDHQRRLITDLLDVSRIISGKLTLETAIVDLAVVARSVIETARPAARAAGLTLAAHLSPAPVCGDAERLGQVIGNLLSNAAKFTPSGGRVTVRLERANGRVRLSVSDTGKGISPDFLPYVFERFRQADGSSARATGGLGLGLAIVRELIHLHSGAVHAESAGEGKGSTFTIDLPTAAPELLTQNMLEPVDETEPIGAPTNALDGVHVLVVDDDPDTRYLIAAILAQEGATVIAEEAVPQALATARRARPDVVVCDLALPGDDGFSLIREIRSWALDEGGAVPVVALTGYARPEDRERTLAAGFQLHLAKPAEPRALVEAIASLSGQHTLKG